MQEMVLTSPKSAHKSMKEQFESVSSYIVDYLWDQPAIYCGTYKKYSQTRQSPRSSCPPFYSVTEIYSK